MTTTKPVAPEFCAANYPGEERRHCPLLDAEAIESIAKRAAKLAVDDMTNSAYQMVGKGVVRKILWVIGLLVVTWTNIAITKGWLKP